MPAMRPATPFDLRPASVSIRQFDYDRATRTFTAEVSETRGFGRVWLDSADEGLTIVGATGAEVVFVITSEDRDADGDVTRWTLTAIDGSGFRAVVFND